MQIHVEEENQMTNRIAFFVYLLPFGLLVAAVGAFLLYVPLFPLAAVATIVLALGLAFLLGMVAGGRRIRISRLTRKLVTPANRPAIEHAKRAY
jgi:hypothetical protein